MKKSSNLGNSIAGIFRKNWRENFVFDAINDTVISYEEFFTKVILYRKKFKKLGLTSASTLVLIMNNSVDLMVLYFAGLLTGIRIVPIDPLKGVSELNEILNQIEYRVIISDISTADFKTEKVIRIEEFRKSLPLKITVKKDDLNLFNKIDYKNPYLIVFTSGSTGSPKGVIHSFENLIKSALSFGGKFNLGSGNTFYHNLPMTYMAGILNQIFMPFIFSSKIVIGNRFGISTINNFWEYPIKYSVNTFWFNPTILSLLMKLDRGSQGIEYMKHVPVVGFVGTAPLNYSLKRKFEKKYNTVLYESYGLSETLFIATESPRDKRKKGSVGKPLKGVKIKFAADKEILLETEWTFLGYVGNDIRNGLDGNKFLSGDLGHIDKNNLLHITGRKKDLIIKGGINISPRRLENFINDLDLFEESVILGIEDEVLGEKIVCFYAPNLGSKDEDYKKVINNGIVEKLGMHYKIDEFFKLDEVFKNINGKVDVFKIRRIYKANDCSN
jgi:long-chain acyl-CoA synthetase